MDSFHLKKDKIYSVTQEESIHGTSQQNRNATYWGVGELLNHYPEIIDFTRYYQHAEALIIAEGEKGNRVSFTENTIFITDSSFLNIFTFPLIHGNPKTALSRVNSIVLTNSTSQKYFGNANPIGKALTIRVPWGEETTYEVTGVTQDIPQQSRFTFDFLLTQQVFSADEFWTVPDYSIHLLVKENVNTAQLATKLTTILQEVPQLESTNRKVVLSLKSMATFQLSNTEYLLAAVGIFIILISWVNYINQLIAQSYWRSKEIGIRRVMGATKVTLITQFVVESSLICFISLVLVIAIYLSLEPSLQSFTNGHLLPLLEDPTLINLIFLAIFLIGIALAASVPAIILFSQNFGTILRNGYTNKIGSIGLRKALVVIQFSISTILMISIFVIRIQLDYMSSKDKGFTTENILIVKAPIVKDTTWNVKRKTVELFKERCAKLPFVAEITSSTTVPSEEYRQETYLSFQDKQDKLLVHQNGVDAHFFDLYDVKFIAGNNFIAQANWKNKSSIILNESAARALNIVDFNKMIHTKLIDHESKEVYTLIGIVKDFHQTSLKYQMRPMAFKFNIFRGHFSVKINKAGLNDSELEEIKQIWEHTYKDASFNYFFLDTKFEAQDKEDRYFGKLFEYFTLLSIIISCLGLFGLSLLISTKRQKEIGIRKVCGASSVDILGIFLKSYLGSLCLSMIIGSPLAYLLMNMWLRNYAYRIEIGFGLVSIAMVSLALIFLVTVAYHTIKSSIANPVAILRD